MKLIYATVNSIRSSIPANAGFEPYKSNVLNQGTQTELTGEISEPVVEKTSEVIPLQGSQTESQPSRSYSDVLSTPRTAVPSVSSSTANCENSNGTQNRSIPRVEISGKNIVSDSERSLAAKSLSATRNQVDKTSRLQNKVYLGSELTLENKNKTDKNTRISDHSGSYEQPIIIDNDPNLFIGVRKKRNVSYYISIIDKRSTYSGFLKFLETKGIIPTQLRLFYQQNSISAKMNISSVYSSLVENEEFWPDEMKCRRWIGRSEWEKEQRQRREEYERKRRERYYEESAARKSRNIRESADRKSRHRYQEKADNAGNDRYRSRRYDYSEDSERDMWYHRPADEDPEDYYSRYEYEEYDNDYDKADYWNLPE